MSIHTTSQAKYRIYWLTIFLLFSISTFCSPSKPCTPVIVISVDTLRADRLSCYGDRRIQTNAIDSLAKGGTLFTQASSQVPLTLPSHVSLLTSTSPFSNGIEDNGQVLAPGATTLATVLKSQGYATGAFIGGFALDRRFGLDQGFDVYDSPFDLRRQKGVDPSDLKRPAEEVTQSAETWLDQNSTGPFFLFLHLYDLHTPYQLPAEARARFGGNGYDDEVRYVDEAVGEFLSYLQKRDLLDKALIVFLSDHGESLGEHGESTHGYFIYQSTLHVPLIIHWPRESGPFIGILTEPTSLLDVAPAILDFLGIAAPSHFQGHSRLELLHSQESPSTEEVYSESLYAHAHYRCSPLRCLRKGRYKYIEAPKPELYDLDHDPHELTNLYSSQRALALSMHRRLLSLLAGYPAQHPQGAPAISPTVVEQLAALGYIASAGGSPSGPVNEADPKDRIAQYAQTHRAISMAYSGRLKESVALLEAVLAETPDLPDTRNTLGLFQQKLGLHQQAARNFRDVLQEDPSNLLAHYNLAVSYFNLNRLDDSVKELNALLVIASGSGKAPEQVTTPAQELLGTISMQQKNYPLARTEFEQLLTQAPRDYLANYNLGWLAGFDGNPEKGVPYLAIAVEVEPDNADGHNELGTLYLSLRSLSNAEAQFAEAIRIAPASAAAHYNLGIVFAQEQENVRAAGEFKLALQADPDFRLATKALEQLEEVK
jgi:arylsulfatase A-like enzyme/Tfp pilus assembly protein PilF